MQLLVGQVGGGKREEGVCLKHLRKVEDPILVILGLNPVGRGTGQGCGRDLTSNLQVRKVLHIWLAPVTEDSGTGQWGKRDRQDRMPRLFFQEGMAQFRWWEGNYLEKRA